MIVKLFLSFFVSLLLGFIVLHVFLPLKKTFFPSLLLKASLAVGLGFGITSCTYLLSLLTLGPQIFGVLIYEGGVFILLIFVFVFYKRILKLFDNQVPGQNTVNNSAANRLLSIGFYSVLGLFFINIFYIAILIPNGTWDAWAIWNMHARFIYRGGEHWRDAFSALLAPKHHPDYPLLLPLTVARGWTYIGKEIAVIPMLVSLLFTLAIVGTTYSALSILKSKSQANLATLVLLSTPVFIKQSAVQQADIPVAFFFLAGAVFLFLQMSCPERYGLSFLSGTMAGLAGWTKNEGLLFWVALILARIIAIFLSQDRKMQLNQFMYFILGSMPVLAIIIYFRIYLAPPNDLVYGGRHIGEIILKLEDYSRYAEILKGFAIFILFTLPQVLLLLFYPMYVGAKAADIKKIDNVMPILVLFLMTAGYFCVYLITPYDLDWHIRSSLHRLLLQLWPSVIFVYFAFMQTPEELLEKQRTEMTETHAKSSL